LKVLPMIGFRLDGRSNVVPYLQLVDQVRQALRTGLLAPGDQLPTVREVAESVSINPNTVLKAYRHLEHEGLVEGRPGQGTFVVRSLAGPSLASHAALRRELQAWLRRARTAGLEPEDIEALFGTTLHAFEVEGVA
jgi:GntR family transcriptional regulator